MSRSRIRMLILSVAAMVVIFSAWNRLRTLNELEIEFYHHSVLPENSHLKRFSLKKIEGKIIEPYTYLLKSSASSEIHSLQNSNLPIKKRRDIEPIQLLFVPDPLQWVKVPKKGTTVEKCDIPCVYGGDTSSFILENTNALILHLPDLNGEHPRKVLEERNLTVSNAYIVGMTLEPTAKYKHQFDRINDYDIEMTFRMTSDVPAIYQKFWKKERDILMDPIIPWEKRKKAVAFVADNCHTTSHRENLVKMLEKHIPVNSMSTCLPNTLWPKDIPRSNRRLNKVVLMRRYLANIAGENSFEKDYVSEKVYDALIAGTVSIYLGAPNIDSFVPSDTIINVPQNFTEADVVRIVKELERIFENKKVYEKWTNFKNRPLDDWFSQRFNFTRDTMKCRLCRRVYALTNGYGWDRNRQEIVS
ncbi:uncharacterized protein LOC135341794 [Halichondria panicea]|uniref:uncharacterized protein LOC135341794 n=1 Tax=Halichondria panicea TaxID=6063 RepID=UPI00312B8DA4